jgi:hypothetical protein
MKSFEKALKDRMKKAVIRSENQSSQESLDKAMDNYVLYRKGNY